MLFAVLGTEADDSHTELRGDATFQPCCNDTTPAQPESMEFRMSRTYLGMHRMRGPINYPAAETQSAYQIDGKRCLSGYWLAIASCSTDCTEPWRSADLCGSLG